jgi:hypothetical protein
LKEARKKELGLNCEIAYKTGQVSLENKERFLEGKRKEDKEDFGDYEQNPDSYPNS